MPPIRSFDAPGRARLATSESESNREDRFAMLKPLVPAIAATWGAMCEVVLHDVSQPDNSIIAISGRLTDRHLGGSMSQIGLSLLAAGSGAEDQYNYVTQAPNGRILKSTTVVLRDDDRSIFGLLCINIDITELRMVTTVLEEFVGSPASRMPQPVTFVDDVSDVLDHVIHETQTAVGRPVDRTDKDTRLQILRALERRGVFTVQRSVPQVARRLGVSRATIYSDLSQLRLEGAGDQPGSTGSAA